MYFMSTACGRLQGEGGPAHLDGGGGQKPDSFVDVINGCPPYYISYIEEEQSL